MTLVGDIGKSKQNVPMRLEVVDGEQQLTRTWIIRVMDVIVVPTAQTS